MPPTRRHSARPHLTRCEVRASEDFRAAGRAGVAFGAISAGRRQTMLANAMRSLAAEFGLIVPKGIGKLRELMELVDADATFPKRALQAIRALLDHCGALAESIRTGV